mgnify:CR=1 FL=1
MLFRSVRREENQGRRGLVSRAASIRANFVADLKRLVLRGQPPESWGLLGTTPVPASSAVPPAASIPGRRSPVVAIGLAVVVIALLAGGAWAWRYLAHVKQARAELPKISALVDAGDFSAAFSKAQSVRRYVADDPLLKSIEPLYTQIYSVSSMPPPRIQRRRPPRHPSTASTGVLPGAVSATCTSRR